ncbi:MAG: hypothetical protein HOV81_01355 [Kofleriaceae bacterium]|nr:hypothetical protein [Kofleriaceae bacterium]
MRAFPMLVCAACGSATPLSPTTNEVPDAARPRATYLVQPGELGDKDVMSRMKHHARVERVGMAWLVLGGTPVRDAPGEDSLDPKPSVSVLGETKQHVRIVDEGDAARVAVWIMRSDLAPAIIAPTEVLDERGRPIGVHLDPGVEVAFADGRSRSVRPVAVRDEAVRVDGFVSEGAIGTVWVGDVPRDSSTRATFSLHADAKLRNAPRNDAPEVATLVRSVVARRIAERGAWSEIEVLRPGIRIHAFVPSSELLAEDELDWVSGGHYGFTAWVTHTDSLEVPAGTCLYDREGGEVVGVTIAARTYSGYKSDEWDTVYVGSMFGSHTLRLHDVGDGSAEPQWESCLEP